MLGVFKKRWKPKRNGSNNVNVTTKEKLLDEPTVDNCTISSNLPKSIHTSPRVVEDNNFISSPERLSLSGGTEKLYPLSPNICVEGGRIEFIRSPLEGSTCIVPYSYATDEENGNVERGEDEGEDGEKEKRMVCDEYDDKTASLEARIRELEDSLELERRLVQKEKLVSAKLQRQLSRKELIQRDVDRERRLRLDAESKLKLSMSDAEKCKTKLSSIQAQFTRMEDTVRSMVQYKTKYEHIKHDKAAITRAYESRLLRLQETVTQLHAENQTLKRQVRNLEVTGFEQVQSALLERLESLEIENCSLRQASDSQRRKYEKCLDDVAHQVVRAILSQKGLREEIFSLRRKLRDTECANIALSNLLLPDRTVVHLGHLHRKPAASGDLAMMWSCELPPEPSATSLNESSTVKALPDQEDEEISGGSSVLRDEGYSTMSSDVQGAQETPRRGLEDLAEIQESQGDTPLNSDSTSVLTTSSSQDKRYLKNLDSDIYLSVSLLLNARHQVHNPRHSFPPPSVSRRHYSSLSRRSPTHFPSPLFQSHYPSSTLSPSPYPLSYFPLQALSHSGPILPYQSIVRSLSDSHLCLNMSPSWHTSVLLSDRWNSSVATDEDIESWTSGDWWEGDCVDHWLRLDEIRGGGMAQYDTSELEDWTMRDDEVSISPCRSDRLLISPSTYDSWSSSSDNCSESLANSTPLGVDFTRDFYRLVKFESTKSLSSTTSAMSNKESVDGPCGLSTKSTSGTNTISPQYSDDSASRKRTSNVAPNQTTSAQIKILRLEDLTSAGSPSHETLAHYEALPHEDGQNNRDICDKNSISGGKTNQFSLSRIKTGGSCEKDATSGEEKIICRKRIISGGSCEKILDGEERLISLKPASREKIISGGSCVKDLTKLPHFLFDKTVSGDLQRVEHLYGSTSAEFQRENLYENCSIVPQYESNNVDQLYGSVRWSDETYATDNEDRFWSEMDKERDRFWSEMDKDRDRDDGEGEIECLQEDFSYEMSSRGVSRNGLRTELNTVIEENEEEDIATVSPLSLPPSPLHQSNSTLTQHQSALEHVASLQPDPNMTRSLTSSISTPDTVVNIHDTRPSSVLIDESLLNLNELPSERTDKMFSLQNELVHQYKSLATQSELNDSSVSQNDLVRQYQLIEANTESCLKDNELVHQSPAKRIELNGPPMKQNKLSSKPNELCDKSESSPVKNVVKIFETSARQNELHDVKQKGLTGRQNELGMLNKKSTRQNELASKENQPPIYENDIVRKENTHKIDKKEDTENFIDSRNTSKQVIDKLNGLIEDDEMLNTISSSTSCNGYSESCNSYPANCNVITGPNPPRTGVCNYSDANHLYANSCNGSLSSCNAHNRSNASPSSSKRGTSSWSKQTTQRNQQNSSYHGPTSSKYSGSNTNSNSSCNKYSTSHANRSCNNHLGSCNKENGSCSQRDCSCRPASLHKGSCNGSSSDLSHSGGSCSQYTGSDGGLCSNTGWIHVEKHIDLADPKARANLLDVMLASSHSSSSSEEEGEDPLGYYHLHALHRFRRQKKVSAATRAPLGALRFSSSSGARTSILGRDDFYVRYGAREREAVASFDFLETLSTGSSLTSGDEEKVTEL